MNEFSQWEKKLLKCANLSVYPRTKILFPILSEVKKNPYSFPEILKVEIVDLLESFSKISYEDLFSEIFYVEWGRWWSRN